MVIATLLVASFVGAVGGSALAQGSKPNGPPPSSVRGGHVITPPPTQTSDPGSTRLSDTRGALPSLRGALSPSSLVLIIAGLIALATAAWCKPRNNMKGTTDTG